MNTFTKFLEVFKQVGRRMAIDLARDQVTPAQLDLWILRAEAAK